VLSGEGRSTQPTVVTAASSALTRMGSIMRLKPRA
jgi:hypothetical protein